MNNEEESYRIYVASEPPSTSVTDVRKTTELTSIEKEPLIDEDPNQIDEQTQTYWKGCEFLKASHLCSSKLSLQSSSSNMCRICHTSTSTRSNPLISPCRCSGTLLFVHKACVVRWLEMSTRKMVPAPRCEICGYDYKRGNVFQIRSVHFPHVDRNSCVLNILFLITLIIMMFCGYFTIRFIQENAIMKRRAYTIASSQATYTWKRRGYFSGGQNTEIDGTTNTDGIFPARPHVSSLFDYKVVSCALLFLLAFFVSLFTQYRAESTVFRCIFRFFVINQNWMIRNYDIKQDPEMAMRRDIRSHTIPTCSIPQPLDLRDPIVLSPSSVSDICFNSLDK